MFECINKLYVSSFDLIRSKLYIGTHSKPQFKVSTKCKHSCTVINHNTEKVKYSHGNTRTTFYIDGFATCKRPPSKCLTFSSHSGKPPPRTSRITSTIKENIGSCYFRRKKNLFSCFPLLNRYENSFLCATFLTWLGRDRFINEAVQCTNVLFIKIDTYIAVYRILFTF